jgi:Vault protein inter-alpha-trypsin domain/von Willebrand factor type A domain
MSYLCGCYYHVASTDYYTRTQKHYLPLVSTLVHSTILSTTSRTTLTQKFTNPSSTAAIKECIYTFPLYEGVSVVRFTCRIGKRVLRGLVKEKQKAKKIFDEAVSRGETAGLLEQAPEASDVFSTKLGNIPAGQTVLVEIEYVGELKHHESEGIRFTIPTKIAPRYGTGPAVLGGFQAKEEGGIKITVDVNMPEGSFIKGVQSPSHPIAVSMGTVSTASTADPAMSKASATLSLGSAALEKDFVLIVQSKDVGIPKAILEIHPTIRNHRALMATLVPKFSLPPSRPEIVFVADRSGSMEHNMGMLISAMKVFLKSMPVGVKFNICSFGSSHSFLWSRSQSYSQETVQQATNHLLNFRADFGGTETFGAIKSTIENRFTDIPLEIILLTDGDIWAQDALFKYVNQQVEQTNGNIRIFPLGIGSGVSHSLIEGLARAGNGFAQAVQQGERLDNCVVRMLRSALSPHITDYTLEVKYEKEDDDFELIDKVTEGMKVLLSENDKDKEKEKTEKPAISLFDTNVNPEKNDLKGLEESSFWLPDIPFPKLHQAPHKIPTLFAFSRTSVYLLMSPETIQHNPTAVILRATSVHGPLTLEIPIESLAIPAETIHQLAAKKAVQDLEEGRGWIYDAKDQNGVLIKERYPSCFDELVKKEAVRLGEKFQIAGKWCSFVAVAANDKEIAEMEDKMAEQKSLVIDEDGEILAGELSSSSVFECFFLVEGDANSSVLIDVEQDDLYAAHEEEDDFEMVGGSPSTWLGPQHPAAAAASARSLRTAARGSRAGIAGMAFSRPSRGPRYELASPIPNYYSPPALGAAVPASTATFGSSNEKVLGQMGNRPMAQFHQYPSASFGPTSSSPRMGSVASQPFGMVAGNAPTPSPNTQSQNYQPLAPGSAFGQPAPPPPAYGSVHAISQNSVPPTSYSVPEYRSTTAHQSRQYYGPTGDALHADLALDLDMDQASTRPIDNFASIDYSDEEDQLTTPESLSAASAFSAQPSRQDQAAIFGHPQQAPPSIGLGPSNLFGGIMAGTSTAVTSTAPAPQKAESDRYLRRLSSMATPKPKPDASTQTPPPEQNYSADMAIDNFPFGAAAPPPAPAPKRRQQSSRFDVSEGKGRRRKVSSGEINENAIPGSDSVRPGSKVMPNAGGPGYQAQSPMAAQGQDGGAIANYYNPSTMAPGGGGGNHALQDYQMQLMILEQQNKKRKSLRTKPTIDWSSKSVTEKVARLIELQTFDGSWTGDEEIKEIMGFNGGLDLKQGVEMAVWITLLVVKWLEIMASEEESVWEMVGEKARGWLMGCGIMDLEGLEKAAANEIEKLK